MKNIFFAVFSIILLTGSFTYSQQERFSAGLLMSRFSNGTNNNRLSDAAHPFGSGVVLSYHFNNQTGIALTGEYYDQGMERGNGSEKAFRSHLSFVAIPLHKERFSAYGSMGLVYSHLSAENAGTTVTNDKLNLRLGIGLDFRLTRLLSINADAGMYTNGWNYNGWSESVGLRYAFNPF